MLYLWGRVSRVSYGDGGWRHIKSLGKSRVVGFSKTQFCTEHEPVNCKQYFWSLWRDDGGGGYSRQSMVRNTWRSITEAIGGIFYCFKRFKYLKSTQSLYMMLWCFTKPSVWFSFVLKMGVYAYPFLMVVGVPPTWRLLFAQACKVSKKIEFCN